MVDQGTATDIGESFPSSVTEPTPKISVTTATTVDMPQKQAKVKEDMERAELKSVSKETDRVDIIMLDVPTKSAPEPMEFDVSMGAINSPKD